MSRQPNNRLSQPGRSQTSSTLLLAGLASLWGTAGLINLCVRAGDKLAGRTTGRSFFEVLFEIPAAWSTQATVVAATIGGVAVAAIAVVTSHRRGGRRRGSRVDWAAAFMGRGRDIEPLTRRAVTGSAERLGVTHYREHPGVPIGVTVAGGVPLFGSWEDTHVDVWGTRTGKTTSRAVPAILDAPGAVLVTSNKRDVVDATRDVRATSGDVWVFDPQGICLEEPRWWWNPLSFVTDEQRAAKLADHFAAGSRDPGAKTDAFFDPAGQDLLAGMLLAAALDNRPIVDVYTWLTRPTDETAIGILRDHGYDLTADLVAGVVFSADKQRSGVFGTAQQMASCLTVRQVARWVNASGPADGRRQFDPVAFVRAGGTLYSLSKEGKGSAGPLVTALTVAVIEAAEQLAVHSPGGRLSTPLVAVLDEAANVCRWRDLPSLYSHYGSRGIVLMTILQSWSQGVEVWGEAGMKKLWSAANVRVYGGGVNEVRFLEDMSQLIGDHDRRTSSVSSGDRSRTVSEQIQRERILNVHDLAALPKGRAVVFASGCRPTLIRTTPWMAGPHADAVRASIKAHDPEAARTLLELANGSSVESQERAA